MGRIWIAGKSFEVDAHVVSWHEGPKFNAHSRRCIPVAKCPTAAPISAPHRTNRYGLRPALRKYGDNPPLAAAQATINQFIVHHDGCPSAAVCFNVLHNERGLSCHFLIDNDGTIYQTLDLAFMGFHAAGFNANSIGVEVSSRGDAKKDPRYYSKKKQKRDIVTCRIHDHTYLCFDFTGPQYVAMHGLAKGLSRILPNLPVDYPQELPGRQSWSQLPDPKSFSGYLGHYHTTRRKWDPGPFDFKKFCEKISGSLCFPLWTGEKQKGPPTAPSQQDALRKRAESAYLANESAQTGFFPVGPFGESRLWHGGIHIRAKHQETVYAPFAGRVVAARMGAKSVNGSDNFVLLKHRMSLGEKTVDFYSLFYHLDDDKSGPAWAKGQKLVRGSVTLLDVPVEAGQPIGKVGLAGPDEVPQVHVEVFAEDQVLGQRAEGIWKVIDGTAGGRFCDEPTINDSIDVNPKDGFISRRELLSFFSGKTGDKTVTRYYITLHTSEWTNVPDWRETLRFASITKNLGTKELDRYFEEQIQPTLWWDANVAAHAGLPSDGVVYHYHPIAFIHYVKESIIKAEALGANGINAFDASEASGPPEGVLDDISDVTGESFVDEKELEEKDLGHHLTLEDLARGYP